MSAVVHVYLYHDASSEHGQALIAGTSTEVQPCVPRRAYPSEEAAKAVEAGTLHPRDLLVRWTTDGTEDDRGRLSLTDPVVLEKP